MQQFQGTPGRRTPQTIAKAARQARQKLQPFARIYGISVPSMLSWKGSARKVLFFHVGPVAQQFGVKPETLLKWATN